MYCEIKDKKSNQRKIYYEKKEDELLQKQNDKYIHFKEIVRTNVELENGLKALEQKTQ